MTQETINLRVNPSDETIRLGPLAVRFLLTGENSTGSVAAFELVVPGAQRLAAPAHSHDHYEETIYGIDGVLTWTVDGKQFDVRPGQALCIPRGAIHRDNNGIRDAKALCVITPAVIGPQYFREAAEVINVTPVVRRTEQRWRKSCAATVSRQLRPRGSFNTPHDPFTSIPAVCGQRAKPSCRPELRTMRSWRPEIVAIQICVGSSAA